MAEKIHRIPPVNDLKDLSDTLQDFYLNQCQNLVLRLQPATGANTGKIDIVVDDANVESSVPKLREFESTLPEEELAGKIAATEDSDKLVLRTYGNVLLGGVDKVLALFDPAPVPKPPALPGGGTPPQRPPTKPTVPAGSIKFVNTHARVANRSGLSDSFLRELVEWGKTAPEEIFEVKPNEETDVYASVKHKLGPYGDILHRRACMLEVMRVLAGFESSWNWNEGRDTKNTPANSPQNEIEAGAWQVSSNSIGFGRDLRALVMDKVKTTEAVAFQAAMKENHSLAMEFIARLLRHTIRHNGPVKRGEIDECLSTDAVKEFQELLIA